MVWPTGGCSLHKLQRFRPALGVWERLADSNRFQCGRKVRVIMEQLRDGLIDVFAVPELTERTS